MYHSKQLDLVIDKAKNQTTWDSYTCVVLAKCVFGKDIVVKTVCAMQNIVQSVRA